MSKDKGNLNQGRPKGSIGLLAQSSREAGGNFHYTHALIEAVGRYSKFEEELLVLKNDEFDLKCQEKGFRWISFNVRPVNLLEKLYRFLFICFPFLPFLGRCNEDYKTVADGPLRLLINPSASLSAAFSKIPFIAVIHDLQDRYYPRYFSLTDRIRRKLVTKCLARRAALIVCESNCVKKDIVQFLKVPEQKIQVIVSPPPSYLRSGDVSEESLKATRQKYQLPKEYLFYPAQLWPHKNHIRLFNSLAYLRDKYRIEIPLILVGAPLDRFKNIAREIKRLKLEGQIQYLGYVTDEEMQSLYKLAKILVMPSLFESVSLPIWEAFSLGLPVLASGVCALPEQVGRAGIIFDPFNIEDMGEKVYQVWTDGSLRQKLIESGFERIKTLTLKRYAKQWEEAIEKSLCAD